MRIIGVSRLNVWRNSPMKPFAPGLPLVESFLITASISLVVISLFRFYDFS